MRNANEGNLNRNVTGGDKDLLERYKDKYFHRRNINIGKLIDTTDKI